MVGKTPSSPSLGTISSLGLIPVSHGDACPHITYLQNFTIFSARACICAVDQSIKLQLQIIYGQNKYGEIDIDNSEVQDNDERSFPQNTEPDQSKTILLHYTTITTNEDMYKISQETKFKLSQTLSTPFKLQTDVQLS